MSRVIILLALVLAVDRAQAFYLDPTTGSLAFQALIGGLLAALTVLRLYWRRMKALPRWLGQLLHPSRRQN